MKLLLIVGSADDTFIYNYAKWLKASLDVDIDVFEFYPSKQQGYGREYYNNVYSGKGIGIPYVSNLVDSFILSHQLSRILSKDNKFYDIIHCHWVMAPVVMVNKLGNFCKKLVITFWGGEFDKMRICGSNKLYLLKLNSFVKNVDAIVNNDIAKSTLQRRLLKFHGAFYDASLGSAPLQLLYELMENFTRTDSKRLFGIQPDKYTVLIGYSGKIIHQHIPIIELLSKYKSYKKKIHLLVPMTRGANVKYVDRVEKALKEAGFHYTLLRGKFLQDKELAQLRNATDVVLQLSTRDGFSRSVVECFCAKSVVIYAEWLNYDNYLKTSGFEGIKVKSLEAGVKTIGTVIDNIDTYSNIVSRNAENGKTQNLWSVCIKKWVIAYKDLLK